MNAYAVTVRLLGACALMGFAASASAQQDYPNKAIRYIVPYTPGGSTSWTSRLIGQRFNEAWGQPVIIDNRPGASTMIGVEAAVRSKPDGYTLVYAGSALASNHVLLKTPYDARKDLVLIATLSMFENLLAVHPSLPVRSVKDLVALAKARPGALNYASSSYGGASHLSSVLLNNVAGIDTQAINYKGGGPAVIDAVSGQVQFIMGGPINLLPHVRSGRLRAIAVTGDKRVKSLPGVPSFAEAGYPAVSLPTWTGLAAPAGTPAPIVEKISAEVAKLAAMPETLDKLEAEGYVPYYNNPAQAAKLLNADIAKFARIIKEGNIKVE